MPKWLYQPVTLTRPFFCGSFTASLKHELFGECRVWGLQLRYKIQTFRRVVAYYSPFKEVVLFQCSHCFTDTIHYLPSHMQFRISIQIPSLYASPSPSSSNHPKPLPNLLIQQRTIHTPHTHRSLPPLLFLTPHPPIKRLHPCPLRLR